MKRKIKYSEVKELGFERLELNCNVFFDSHGYNDFLMQLKIGKYLFSWDSEEEHVELRKYSSKKDNANLQSTLKIKELNELNALVNFFKNEDSKNVYIFVTNDNQPLAY